MDSTISLLYNYLIGDNQDGIIAKNNQMYDKYKQNLKNVPDGKDIISKDILSKLDSPAVLMHRGSVGVIYKSTYKNKDIGIKIVLPKTKKKFEEEGNGITFFSSFAFFNKNLQTLSSGITKTMCEETDMIKEKENCLLLRKCILPNDYGIDILKPVDLCNSFTFVYEYDNGIPFEEVVKKNYNEEKKINICKRLIKFVFYSNFNKNIILYDANIGNWLYNEKNDRITYIDYGCIGRPDKSVSHLIKKLYKSSSNKIKFEIFYSKYNVSPHLIDTIWNTTRGFFEDEIFDFRKIPDMKEINIIGGLMKTSLPDCLVLLLRSSMLLLSVIKKFGVNTNFVSDIKEVIQF